MSSEMDSKKFVEALQSDLRLLSTEARKRHTQIKDAAETCIERIRNIASKSDHDLIVGLSNASTEVLHPLLMGLDSKSPKLVQVSLTAIQRLISAKALDQNGARSVVNELYNLVDGGIEELKLLQTVTLLLTCSELVQGPLLSKALVICFRLHLSGRESILVNTAGAAVRQLVSTVVERAMRETAKAGKMNGLTSSDTPTLAGHVGPSVKLPPPALLPCAADAFMLFQDICALLSHDHQPVWLMLSTSLPRDLGLDLIELVLVEFSDLFSSLPEFTALLKDQVCPLVIRLFSPNVKLNTSSLINASHSFSSPGSTTNSLSFSVTMRLLRVISVLITLYAKLLATECEIFLTLVVKFLNADKHPWQRALALEVLHKITAEPNLLSTFCQHYDMKPHSSKVVQDIVNALGGFVYSTFNQLTFISSVDSLQGEMTSLGLNSTPSFYYQGASIALASTPFQSGTAKSFYLEMRDKAEPMPVPDGYCLSVAYVGLVDCCHSVNKLVTSTTSMPAKGMSDAEVEMCRKQLVNSTVTGLLSALNTLLEASIDENVTESLLRCLQMMIGATARLHITDARDQCLNTVCKTALPPNYSILVTTGANPQIDQNEAQLNQIVAYGFPCPTPNLPSQLLSLPLGVTTKNVQAMRALLSTTQQEALHIDTAWHMVLSVLQHFCWLLSLNPGVGGLSPAQAASELNGQRTEQLTSAVIADIPVLQAMISKLFDCTKNLDEVNLHHVLDALCKLSHEAMVVAEQGKEPSFFGILRIMQISLVNMRRLNVFWKLVTGHLLEACAHPHGRLRAEGSTALVTLIEAALQFDFGSSPPLDIKTLQRLVIAPLHSMSNLVTSYVDVSSPVLSIPGDELEPDASQQPADHSTPKSYLMAYDDVIVRQMQCAAYILRDHGSKLYPDAWPSVLNCVTNVVTSDHKFGDSAVQAGFSNCQLVVTDFMSQLNVPCLLQLIEMNGKYGLQQQDLNIALTAVGLLWNVSDYLFRNASRLQALERSSPTGAPISVQPRKALDSTSSESSSKLSDFDSLWLCLFTCLSDVCADLRAAVRKSACQTLFQTIVAHGGVLEPMAWHMVLWQILFPLLDRVKALSSMAPSARSEGDANILMHHTRDTASKQWAETRVLTLSGVVRVFNYKLGVLSTLANFDKAWQTLLQYIESAGRVPNSEVALAALKSFQELLQLSCEESVGGGVNSLSVDLLVKAWKTWLSMAHSSCDAKSSAQCLCTLLQIFPPLFEQITSHFSAEDMTQLATILKAITRIPIAPSDHSLFLLPLSSPDITPTQAAALDVLNAVAKKAKSADSPLTVTLPQVLHVFCEFSTYACRVPNMPAVVSQQAEQSILGQGANYAEWVIINYVPFAERSLKFLVELYSTTAQYSAVVDNGCLTQIVEALHLPLALKYRCPAQSTWKLALNALINVLKVYFSVTNFSTLWPVTSSVIEDFLFTQSERPPTLSFHELKEQENLDRQLVDLIRYEILPYASVLPDEFINRIIGILNRGSILTGDSLNSAQDLRESLARHCFDTLLKFTYQQPDLVSGAAAGNVGARNAEIGARALQSLLERCQHVLTQFVRDDRLQGQIPVPRHRVVELNSVLKALVTLIESLKTMNCNTSIGSLWSMVIQVYPTVVDLVSCKQQSDIGESLTGTLKAYGALLRPLNSN